MNKARDDNLKWFTIVEYIDIDTGEIITKSLCEREYIRLRKNKKIEIIEKLEKNEKIKSGLIKYTYECERNKQLRLF